MNDPEIDIDILDDNDQDTNLKGASGNGYGKLFYIIIFFL